MQASDPIGVFGGAFDPIHIGHLRTAFELMHAVRLQEVRFLPCHMPPHRQPAVAPAGTRWRMVQAAVLGQPGFVPDDRELRRSGTSWTVETLESLQAELPGRTFCLLLGMDAFLGLASWHRWEDVLRLAHIVIARRPGWIREPSGLMGEVLARREAGEPADLHRSKAGLILVQEVTRLEVASSAIRRLIAAGGDPRYLVPETVRDIIVGTGCYLGADAAPDHSKEISTGAE